MFNVGKKHYPDVPRDNSNRRNQFIKRIMAGQGVRYSYVQINDGIRG